MVEGPSPVAVGLDGLDDGMLGGGPGSEACPVAHLVLHRGEERLGRGVVMAVAGAAARQAHVVGAHPLASVLWCIGSSYRCRIWRFQPRICATSPTPALPSRCRPMSAVMRSESNRQPPCACTGRPRRLGRASPPQYEGMLCRRPACRWKRGS